jgi:hypothetical protein
MRGDHHGPARRRLPAAVGGGVVAALLAVLAAGRRAARVPPTRALTEAAVEPRLLGPGHVRWAAGDRGRRSPWPGLVTTAVPVGSRSMVSVRTTNSRVRVRVPSPEGSPAPRNVSVRSVCVHTPRVPVTPGQRLGRSGDDLAVGDQRRDVPEHPIGQCRVVGRPAVGELLRAKQQAEPGGAAPPEQPHDAGRGDGGELVDEHKG